MTKGLFGQTVLTLSPTRIAIEWNARLWHSKEVCSTETVYSFRFADPSEGVPVQNKVGQNEIQFTSTDGTHTFGTGVTREEAEVLITKMMEVYPFPKYRPSESAAGAEPSQDSAFP